jgi:aspartyl-tRNA(Asn)/glutamyl-tRNA(Gln) amidotransferase subunit C
VSVSLDDVRHIAALARLGLSDDRARALMTELNGILGHMEVLARVDTSAVAAHASSMGAGMPLRPDGGTPDAIAHRPSDLAPSARDGFLLVPRLATHETAEES